LDFCEMLLRCKFISWVYYLGGAGIMTPISGSLEFAYTIACVKDFTFPLHFSYASTTLLTICSASILSLF
jgi:hypothetical protein